MTWTYRADLADCLDNLGYSMRRYFIDEFYFRHVSVLPKGCRVLDAGGETILKRGQFALDAYSLDVVSINISPRKNPDVLADASYMPFAEGAFDAVICSELIEHAPDPRAVLGEAYRVLRKGGVFFCTSPFLFRIHGQPGDYGRYTDDFWNLILPEAGFSEFEIERQGHFWCVLADMIRSHIAQNLQTGRFCWPLGRRLTPKLVTRFERKAISRDARAAGDPFYASFTTGFGVRAVK